MKNYFIKIALFIGIYSLMNNSFAQNTIQQWNVAIHDESFSPEHPHPTWYTYILKTIGDTIINDLNYKKIYKSCDSLFLDYSYFANIRFDSGMVYMNTYGNSQNDFLLYDFNLKKNDTTTIYRVFTSLVHQYLTTVDSVKEIEVNNKILKKIFVTYSFYDMKENDIWIEGIGSVNHGLLNESCFGGTGCYITSYLLCYKEDGKLLLQDTSFNTCFYQTVTSKINNVNFSSQCKIYPSLLTANTKVSIESNNLINRIKIFDLQGEIVYYKKLRSLNYKLDLNYLKNGFYLILVNDNIYKLLIAR